MRIKRETKIRDIKSLLDQKTTNGGNDFDRSPNISCKNIAYDEKKYTSHNKFSKIVEEIQYRFTRQDIIINY